MLRAVRMTAVMLCLAASSARAADIDVVVSAREVFLEDTFTVSIEVINATSHERPMLPRIEGASMRYVGRTNSSRQQGVIRTSKVIYEFAVTPRRLGPLTIPAVTLTADGETLTSQPLTVMVVDEASSGEVLFAELEGVPRSVYVGEPLEATLHVWIRPYRDREFQVTLGEGDMWSLISQTSTWGLFTDRMEELTEQNQRPSGREELRETPVGERSYYHYRIPLQLWPERAERLVSDEIEIKLRYPTRLQRESGFFRDNLRLAGTRPVQVTLPGFDVEVKEVPREDRPPTYAGAVGRFEIGAAARPDEVAVGDPVTLTLTLVDLTGGRMEVLKPPLLMRVPELTERFRMPTEPLAGVVEGNRKRFTQTIRAVSEDVTEIPAIPFTYFDPRQERFVTVSTSPIPIRVTPASSMSMSDVVGAAAVAASDGGTDLTEVAGGLLANYNDPSTLLADDRFAPAWWHAVLLVLAPAAWLATLLTTRRLTRLRTDHGFARGRRARRTALRGIADASRTDAGRQAELVAAAVRGYVADRCNLPAGAVTRADVVQSLEQGGVAAEVVADLESLLQECEQQQYAGGTAANGVDLARRATESINRLEREL